MTRSGEVCQLAPHKTDKKGRKPRRLPGRPKTVQGVSLASAKSTAVAGFGPPVFRPRRCKAGLWPQAKTGRSCRLWALFPGSPGKCPQLKSTFRSVRKATASSVPRREKAVDPGGDAPASPTGSPGRAEAQRKALPGGRSRRTRLPFPVPERRLRRSATGSRRVVGSADRADLCFLRFRSASGPADPETRSDPKPSV